MTAQESTLTAAPAPARAAYSIVEVAAMTSLARTTIYKEIRAGRLHVSKVGRRALITQAQFDAWMRRAERGGAQ